MPLEPPTNLSDEGFGTFEELFDFVNTWAKGQGYAILRRRPANYKDGDPRRFDLACEAGGQIRPSASTGLRKVTSKKTSCPWKAKAVARASIGRWFFELTDGTHNHGPVQIVTKGSRSRRRYRRIEPNLETSAAPPSADPVIGIVRESPTSTPAVPERTSGEQRPGEQQGDAQRQPHTRTLAACDACRISKTRCDATRPECANCIERGRRCVYPDNDPSSIFEVWGTRILEAINDQGWLLRDLARVSRDGFHQSARSSTFVPHESQDDMEMVSRKDVPWTPITSSDKLLNWSVFPQERPVATLPASAHTAKPNPYVNETFHASRERMWELRDMFLVKCEPKCPIIDVDQLDAHITDIIENGFGSTAVSCLVLLVFALASIWGNYPNDERRHVASTGAGPGTEYTVAVPEHRAKESWIYFAMAQRLMPMASMDDSLLGVTCFCLFGTWYSYNFEPIQAWKMFRTASMLWEAYNLKHTSSNLQRSSQEESLEQRLYWTCMKAECEMRYEIPELPLCSLQESRFPFSLPSFPTYRNTGAEANGTVSSNHNAPDTESAPLSYYYFLAEISLRRLLNRARHAAARLSPDIDSRTARQFAETFKPLEYQLQQWLECLPPCLQFSLPPDSLPPADEPELVKLMRERYVEVRELLSRAFLYICLHAGSRLTPAQARTYGAKASAGLRLSVYRIKTEKPFFRHAGSWIACRVRFNQALCLLAAVRGKELRLDSAAFVNIPPNWWECVQAVKRRLETWSDQGGGTEELATLLRWLTEK